MPTIENAPDWLIPLLRAIRREAIAPRDARIKLLWDLLRQRGLLSRDPWLRDLLRRIWQQGLAARSRPRTTRRMRDLLRTLGILPPRAPAPVVVQGPLRPFRSVIARPLHPVSVRPVRPARVAAVVRGRGR
jgi:hypothetical protein